MKISTRDKILNISTVFFRQDGYEQVSVRDICGYLGISPGNFSYHFPKKEILLDTLLNRLFEREVAIYEGFDQMGGGLEALLRTIRLLISSLEDERRILKHHLFREYPEKQKSVIDQRHEYFQAMLESVRESGDLVISEEDVLFLASFLQFLIRSWSLDNPDEDGSADKYIYFLAQQLYYFSEDGGRMIIDDFLLDLETNIHGSM